MCENYVGMAVNVGKMGTWPQGYSVVKKINYYSESVFSW